MLRFCVLVSVLLACVAAQYYATNTPKPGGQYCYECYLQSGCEVQMDMSYDAIWCTKGCYVMTNMGYGYEMTWRGCYDQELMKDEVGVETCFTDYCNDWRVDHYWASSATIQRPLLLLAPLAAVVASWCS